MSQLVRLAFILGLVGAGVLATAGRAPAQFWGGYGRAGTVQFGFPGTPGFGFPQFNYSQRFSVQIGPISYSEGYYGPVGYWMMNQRRQALYAASYSPLYSFNSSGYMSGGVRNPGTENLQRNFARAQQLVATQSNPTAARNAIYDQWAYEKLGGASLPELKTGEAPAALVKAMAATREADVASGEALNHVMVAVVAAEPKGGKVDSAYLPPNLLNEVRFAGPPAADAVNLIRQAGRLNIPAVFDDGPLADVRPDLERDFAAAAAPVLAGKASDQAKVGKLEAAVKKARAILDPLTTKLEFEDAIAARRLLNRMDTAVTVLKGSGTAGLVDPRWGTEGANVADLVKYMTKNKVLFGPVGKGNEDAYLALHHGLVAYLYGLNDSQPKPVLKK
ncbi:MAG: hypothetical protein JWO38_7819 [Gemmataceae bacterium]|nr:hypothetical protein [Gemmataceae bacterium]